jgi:DNA-directed RNA polymerase subunit M/transcription elongation factor TFIIS
LGRDISKDGERLELCVEAAFCTQTSSRQKSEEGHDEKEVITVTEDKLEIIQTDIVKLVEGCPKCGNKIAFFQSLTIPRNPDLQSTIVWTCMNCSSSIEIKAKNSKGLYPQVETWISEELPEKETDGETHGIDFGTFFDNLVEWASHEENIEYRRKLWEESRNKAFRKKTTGSTRNQGEIDKKWKRGG